MALHRAVGEFQCDTNRFEYFLSFIDNNEQQHSSTASNNTELWKRKNVSWKVYIVNVRWKQIGHAFMYSLLVTYVCEESGDVCWCN